MPLPGEGPGAYSAADTTPPVIHPLTPLGIPYTPPPLPKLPSFLFTSLPPAASEDFLAVDEAGQAADPGSWTPVSDQESKIDRRTFFHTEGKSLTFAHAHPVRSALPFDVGEKVTVQVEDVHFGNPRIRVMQGEPAPMPTMLKWPLEKFNEHALQCAQVSFGSDYRVWCAVGIPANRLLYAMKRCKVELAQATVVMPPALAEPEEDLDLTYGTSIQGIQLVP